MLRTNGRGCRCRSPSRHRHTAREVGDGHTPCLLLQGARQLASQCWPRALCAANGSGNRQRALAGNGVSTAMAATGMLHLAVQSGPQKKIKKILHEQHMIPCAEHSKRTNEDVGASHERGLLLQGEGGQVHQACLAAGQRGQHGQQLPLIAHAPRDAPPAAALAADEDHLRGSFLRARPAMRTHDQRGSLDHQRGNAVSC